MSAEEILAQMEAEPIGTYMMIIEMINGRTHMTELSLVKRGHNKWVFVDDGREPDAESVCEMIIDSTAVYAFS